jgi:copper chaperone CopZ
MNRDATNVIALVAAVLLLAIGGPLLARELRTLPRGGALAARAGQRVVTLEVIGMTCTGCAAEIQANLTATPGISDVEVRFKQHRAYVVCDRAVADTSIMAAVHRAGPGFVAEIVSQ